jgi:hypothetical protein
LDNLWISAKSYDLQLDIAFSYSLPKKFWNSLDKNGTGSYGTRYSTTGTLPSTESVKPSSLSELEPYDLYIMLSFFSLWNSYTYK